MNENKKEERSLAAGYAFDRGKKRETSQRGHIAIIEKRNGVN